MVLNKDQIFEDSIVHTWYIIIYTKSGKWDSKVWSKQELYLQDFFLIFGEIWNFWVRYLLKILKLSPTIQKLPVKVDFWLFRALWLVETFTFPKPGLWRLTWIWSNSVFTWNEFFQFNLVISRTSNFLGANFIKDFDWKIFNFFYKEVRCQSIRHPVHF